MSSAIVNPYASGAGAEHAAPAALPAFRDDRDVRAGLRKDLIISKLALLLLISGALNVYQHFEAPMTIVIERLADGAGRVTHINEQEVGQKEGLQYGPDRILDEDKLFLVRRWTTYFYNIDPSTRQRDLEQALRLMLPGAAQVLGNELTKQRQIERERKESWQAVWKIQDVSIDREDPWTVRVLGTQELTRVVAGAPVKETHQISLAMKLVADPERRREENLRTGVRLAGYEWKEVSGPSETEGR